MNSTATAALDPAAAIAAAGRELLDQLRELGDRGNTDDVPGLLDELSTLLRRARGKVNRATKKRAEQNPADVTDHKLQVGERAVPLAKALAPFAARTAGRRAEHRRTETPKAAPRVVSPARRQQVTATVLERRPTIVIPARTGPGRRRSRRRQIPRGLLWQWALACAALRRRRPFTLSAHFMITLCVAAVVTLVVLIVAHEVPR